ncbi:MAG: stage V sporulation protein AB [Clostridiales bacterium]|nr:stage V sporulation protein AB [Clostridiales bacterium]
MGAFGVFLCILFGFSAGLVISGAVFAFIAIIGIVPRLAQKTRTENHVKLYEEAIIFGGITGALTLPFDFEIPAGKIFAAFFAFCVGIFYGTLAVSLAEVLDVIPILTRRVRIQDGLSIFIIAIAAGKLFGSVLYYVIPGFFKNSF